MSVAKFKKAEIYGQIVKKIKRVLFLLDFQHFFKFMNDVEITELNR